MIINFVLIKLEWKGKERNEPEFKHLLEMENLFSEFKELWIAGKVTGDGVIHSELDEILWRPVSPDLTPPLSTNIYGCL